jgi:hypothetical protein
MNETRDAIKSTALTIFFVATSVWLFCFGVAGTVVTFYGFFPLAVRETIWEYFPPEYISVNSDVSDFLSLICIVTALWFASHIWVSFKKWRIFLVLVLVLEGLLLSHVLDKIYSHLPMF